MKSWSLIVDLRTNPQTAARIRAYLDVSGHAADIDGPLFRPLNHNGKQTEKRRRVDTDAIDRVVWKYAGAEPGLLRDSNDQCFDGYSELSIAEWHKKHGLWID